MMTPVELWSDKELADTAEEYRELLGNIQAEIARRECESHPHP